MDTVAGRRRHTSPKKPRISEVAEERQEKGLRGMFRDVDDDKSAQRFSYAAKVHLFYNASLCMDFDANSAP